MMKIYRTQDKQLTRVDDMSEGTWICLTSPTDDEVRRVAATLDIETADIVAATDPEESARISLEDGYTVIIVDIPIKVEGAGEGVYSTIPLGILLTQELIVTVCSADTAVIGLFHQPKDAVRLPAALSCGLDVPAGAAPDRPPPSGH